jgi:pyruvate dehydrogenase E1 component alpha subunit
MTHTPQTMIAFTERIKQAFIAKKIHSPVHLCGGNEDEVIEAFKVVKPGDWVFSGWRSAYHALLKGIPEQWVYDEIIAGRSMYLMNKYHRFFCSSIVGGILPIACGVAMEIKRSYKPNNCKVGHHYLSNSDRCLSCGMTFSESCDNEVKNNTVHVFVGDMTAMCGIFFEFLAYCEGHELPVRVVVEDNGLSTNTPTEKAWGGIVECRSNKIKLERYKYERTQPHVGVGQHVHF